MVLTNRKYVVAYLKLLKKAAENSIAIAVNMSGSSYDKNARFIDEAGLTMSDVQQIICNLTLSDYSSGPDPDDKGKGLDVWKFGKSFQGYDVYIKTVIFGNPDFRCLYISFHEALYPMNFPFKGDSENG